MHKGAPDDLLIASTEDRDKISLLADSALTLLLYRLDKCESEWASVVVKI